MNKSVFISYARVDRARVAPIANALENAGFNVWWDARLVAGAAFSREIEHAIEQADAVVVLWSNASIGSDWVRDEAGHGRDARKLVPALLDSCLPPLGFRQYHAVDLSDWRGNPGDPQFNALVAALVSPGQSAPALSVRPRPRTSRRVVIGSAVALAAAGAGGLAWRRNLFGSPIDGNTVAVLPFTNLSGDPGQAYFPAGLSEEIRAALSRDARLRVMAPASTARVSDDALAPGELARRLGVATILSGSVRRGANIVRVTATLVEGRSGFTIWSQVFDRQLADVLAVESEIASAVASALGERIGRRDGQAPRVDGSKDATAYDAYLRGRDLYAHVTDESAARQALAQFDAAIAADPGFAAAYAGRARALYVLASQFGTAGSLRTTYEQALASAQRAVALAPGLPDAQSTLAYVLFQGLLRVREARVPYEQSRISGAGDASIVGRYAIYAAATGNVSAARDAIERALLLDPFNALVHRVAGYVAYARRDYAAALAALAKALALNAKLLDARAWTGDARLALGDPVAARAAYLAEPHALLRLTGLAIVEQRMGRAAEARAAQRALIDEFGDSSTYQQALILAQWGDRAGALERLDHAARVPDVGLMFVRADPLLDPLRGETRFNDLLKALGFV